jgi:hypothetical protein
VSESTLCVGRDPSRRIDARAAKVARRSFLERILLRGSLAFAAVLRWKTGAIGQASRAIVCSLESDALTLDQLLAVANSMGPY